MKCKTCKKEHNTNFINCEDCRKVKRDWFKNDIKGWRTKRKEYYYKNQKRIAEWRRITRLKKKYLITDEEFNKMLIKQNNKCLICKKDFKGIKPCVDHNHKTNKVRGLLCRRCNLDLQVVENKEFLQKAITYLEINDV